MKAYLLIFIVSLLYIPTIQAKEKNLNLCAPPKKRVKEGGAALFSHHSPRGKDAILLSHSSPSSPPPPALLSPNLAQKSCQSAIRFFQNYISDIDGPRSHFYPTSSRFTAEAIACYGVLGGILRGCDRLMRENADPWVYPLVAPYGIPRKYDPVPEKKQILPRGRSSSPR